MLGSIETKGTATPSNAGGTFWATSGFSSVRAELAVLTGRPPFNPETREPLADAVYQALLDPIGPYLPLELVLELTLERVLVLEQGRACPHLR